MQKLEIDGKVILAKASARGADAHRPGPVLTATVNETQQEGSAVTTFSGAYARDGLSLPFERRIESGDGGAVRISETVDFATLGDAWRAACHRLDVPLELPADEHERMFAFGGAQRDELFRMDMNDVPRRKQNMSDSRAVWPYWDIGGVLQLPGPAGGSYTVWKANHADTPAYPVEMGTGAPGWADFSSRDGGVTVRVCDSAPAAPWAIVIDARAGVLSIQPQPASQPSAGASELGKRTFAFTLEPHAGSWPTAHACELPADDYARLLEAVNQAARDTLEKQLGLSDPDQIIHLERVQPSVVLRLLYRYDDTPMRQLLNQLGRSAPENMSYSDWEKLAAGLISQWA
jgi:hypothetical protein